MHITRATAAHADSMWEIFHQVVASEDTYVFNADISRDEALAYWTASSAHTYVAMVDGRVVGTYLLKPNQPGLGAHVANASYMVAPEARGLGIGSAMCAHSIEEARKLNFLAMQFNLVVSTNKVAIELWKKHGFQVVGVLPKVFRHQQLGYVDAFVMHRFL